LKFSNSNDLDIKMLLIFIFQNMISRILVMAITKVCS